MGPNGAGKSTLGYALMGNPKYQITGGKILFEGKDISEETPDKRARMVCSYLSRIRWKYRALP